MTRDEQTGDIIESKIGIDMSTSDGRLFKKEPALNVISKEEFEQRIGKVFDLLGKTLAKSFGPYGAPTIIYNYPYSHVTKDGYTIFKSLSFDVSETLLDQCISDLAGDICGRINYTVGDGTTSAIIATNNVYKNYRLIKPELDKLFILPRDVLKKYELLKIAILDKLKEKAIRIDDSNPDILRKNIYDVVYISSNGDETYSTYIADLYKEIGGPMITSRLAPDGMTKKDVIKGFKYDIMLNDYSYINTDERTMVLKNADVVIFNVRITQEIYEKILKPLSESSKLRERCLLVAAPGYDDTAVKQFIAPALVSEKARTGKMSLVLTTFRNTTQHASRLMEDFAMMMNTTVIDRSLLTRINEQISASKNIEEIFNFDGRNIDGLDCLAMDEDTHQGYIYKKGELDSLIQSHPHNHIKSFEQFMTMIDQPIELGYVKECTLSSNLNTQSSYFTELVYNKERYDDVVAEAENSLNEAIKKYSKLGTYNLEVNQCQERLFALKLNMGVIEVGADTEMSQKLIKDAVDDAVKAAASAYRNGVVLGCNLNLIQVMYEMYNDAKTTDEIQATLIKILLQGFIDVYRTVLTNAFDDIVITDINESVINNDIKEFIKRRNSNIIDCDFTDAIHTAREFYHDDISYHKILIMYSIINNKVFNLTTFGYTSDVINSVQTDEEILKAVIDLISLLITGNQMLVTQKHAFD